MTTPFFNINWNGPKRVTCHQWRLHGWTYGYIFHFQKLNKHSVAKALSMLSLLGFFFSSSKVFVVQIIWLNQCSTIELHWFPHPKTLEKWQSSGFISKVSTLSSSPRSSFLTIRAFDRERINGFFFFLQNKQHVFKISSCYSIQEKDIVSEDISVRNKGSIGL